MKTKSTPKTPRLCPCCAGKRGQLTLAQRFELEEAYYEALDAEYEPEFEDEGPKVYWEDPEFAQHTDAERAKNNRKRG